MIDILYNSDNSMRRDYCLTLVPVIIGNQMQRVLSAFKETDLIWYLHRIISYCL